MRRQKKLLFLLFGVFGLGGVSALVLSCADYLTGQLEEPGGPIQITKLTLFDQVSRDQPVFTDTSLPDCRTAPDCTTPENRDLTICQVCYNDVLKDIYSPLHSPPTPDSGQDIRVVFNKVPLQWNGADIQSGNNLGQAISLNCMGCQGVPPHNKNLVVTGSGVTFDPTTIPYGPALQIVVNQKIGTDVSGADILDPRIALEPDTAYLVDVNPGVAGRDGQAVNLDANARKLLIFHTEPFKVLRVGKGDSKGDAWVYADNKLGDGTPGNAYKVADLPTDGVVVLRTNAAVDPVALQGVKVMADVDGMVVNDVVVRLNLWQVMNNQCVTKTDRATMMPVTLRADQRSLLVYRSSLVPWPAGRVLSLTIPQNAIRDVTQAAGANFGSGQHTLGAAVVVSAALTGKQAPSNYAGVTVPNVQVQTAQSCAMPMVDMGSSDGAIGDGGADAGAPQG